MQDMNSPKQIDVVLLASINTENKLMVLTVINNNQVVNAESVIMLKAISLINVVDASVAAQLYQIAMLALCLIMVESHALLAPMG